MTIILKLQTDIIKVLVGVLIIRSQHLGIGIKLKMIMVIGNM